MQSHIVAAGQPLKLRFKVVDHETKALKAGVRDLRVLVFHASGTWQRREWATAIEYVEAIRQVHTIAPSACREVAMRRFHYRVMAEGYVKQYERIIAAELVEVPDYSA